MSQDATNATQSPSLAVETAPAPAGREPRRRRVGGLVISIETMVKWAQRLEGGDHNSPMHSDRAWIFVSRKVRSCGGIFEPIGEELGEEEFMVVTQVRAFNGWRGMDRALVPAFEEGEMEEWARELLQEEGLTPDEYEFRTEVTGGGY